MLHEPTPLGPPLAPPAALTTPEPRISPETAERTGSTPLRAVSASDADPSSPSSDLPTDLRPLGRRARRDTAAARELAAILLGRHWEADLVAVATGMAPAAVSSLAGVRRPGTASGFVADEIVARARSRAVPTPRVS